MLKNKRLLLVTPLLVVLAGAVLGLKVGYPHHRLWAFILLAAGWIPIMVSYRINRRLLRVRKIIIKKKTRPFLPHTVVALLLLIAFYVTWALFPVETSPLAKMAAGELRSEIATDLGTYHMLRKTGDDLVAAFEKNGLLAKNIDTLTGEERAEIRRRWRDGVMAFLEFDMLKGKYRGFHQIDYVAEPQLHSDAFFIAYASYITQYNACLQIVGMVGENEFMKTLLNEEGEGIPADSFFNMKQRITHPQVMLRINAGTAYYELVKKDISIEPATIADFEARRKEFYKRLGDNPEVFVDNPLEFLERAAFETFLPVQKKVAIQMSYIRTAKRDYLITPEIIAQYKDRFRPGDILVQRRNWHMTNIGIPGFWPHVALYVGTPAEIDDYFSELGFQPLETIKALYPEVFQTLEKSEDGFPMTVIEAIRPGVVFQSLETSARCDYLAVVRPKVSKADKFKALLAAFSHYGKPYDLNFDFSTDNELVCSELVYKAYRPGHKLPFEPEIINGRLLLPPNQLVEQCIVNFDDRFEFVLFLDAVEKTGRVEERGLEAFRQSWARPKWDLLQK
ncbi:MAG: hypothetical protein K9M45_09245 [Kiritimatiellales bacterium]|nr:hypothetical protein [Kiritimatiellales bacterium]